LLVSYGLFKALKPDIENKNEGAQAYYKPSKDLTRFERKPEKKPEPVNEPAKEAEEKPETVNEPAEEAEKKPETVNEPVEEAEEEPDKTYAAIVIDDLGGNYSRANELMSIGLDFTLSILPGEAYSVKVANRAKDKGFELMLHIPMEPYDYPEEKNPGENALLISMTNDELKKNVNEMLDSSLWFSGVNNHMGSRFCEDYEKISVVMAAVKERGLYFLDSKTSDISCINKVANIYDVPNASRHVFLDNSKEEAYILKQIDKVIRISKKYKRAIAICHPYPETIAALEKTRKKFEDNNIEIKRLSEIIKLTSPQKEPEPDKRLTLKDAAQR
jgi:polysaccharide deacetylase 2 family uncharacterized protein YibQ